MILRKQLVAVGLVALVVGGTIVALPSQTAQAQADQYERKLVGIRLNSKATAVLKAFGNPNDVVVGDVGIREAPTTGGAAGGASAGGVAPGGFGAGGGKPRGGFGAAGGNSPGGFGGPPPGFGGPPPGFGGSSNAGASTLGGADDGDGRGGGAAAGFPGGGGFPGAPAGVGGGTGQFGATTSNLTPQQETTWIYNRRAGKDVVSYEFLVGQGGAITQIRTIGYAGGNVKTNKAVVLGSTYKEVVQKYGYPEEQYRVGRSLIASYKNKNHVLFQFLNQRGQAENPFSAGNKVIAVTIASVE